MGDQETIRQIRDNIAAGHEDLARMQVADLASRSADAPMTMLTCASLLLTLEDEEGFRKVVSGISSNVPSDLEVRCNVASALIALDVPRSAFDILVDAGDSEEVRMLRASALFSMMKYSEALECLEGISSSEADILRMQALASVRKYDEAFAIADPLVDAGGYKACRAYVTMLMKAGRDKDAMKYVRMRAKEKGADGSALMAQYQWLTGNTPSAGAYAAKAIKADEGHTGAMEYLGYSLADKGKIREAKIVAGAINEKEPGNAAAFRIIVLCRGKQ